MQRLVQVADEMHDELQRIAPRSACLPAVGEDAALRIDGRDDAPAIGAVALLVKAAAAAARGRRIMGL